MAPLNRGHGIPARSRLRYRQASLHEGECEAGLFQTQILDCKVKPLIGQSAQVVVTPLRAGTAQPWRVWPLFLGLHVLHAYTRLKMSRSKVSMVIRNMSKSPIFLKKGVQVARVVSASPVLLAEFSWRWK